jgi:transposase
MPKAYSGDLRERVIEAVAAGASRREAAERFEVSVASAVKWLQRWRDNNSAAPKPARRKHFSAGRVCGADTRSDRPKAGPDFGGDRR